MYEFDKEVNEALGLEMVNEGNAERFHNDFIKALEDQYEPTDGGGLVTVWDINIPVLWGFDSEGFADIEIPSGQTMQGYEFTEFWNLLGDEPTTLNEYNETVLEKDFLTWKAGTPIEDVWQEASRHYNKPLLEMLHGTE